ncbi:MAG: transcriptional repressor LexA [Alkalibacterium gilvum]|uniref:LexA repressor n=1 Tax=Alkalibacterium gilvum TaxID=1130080 RepID=A0A1H6QYU5_9LACT|nr:MULTISPECIES: transcriptional repressor LexA [Alkalibacterium]MDN6293100.1 transcriptional repressor LexA [Alkalibacterium sp.]MDN6294759.1 transcriptional repressor LexA [Alkalibacterium sp.]MDN6397594.1 transcriptional repressor LexA [Alkalibacterium sp.]MDN6728573.1 transcriptional repressor LexA [Alkalibacterium sp.]SEI48769.1 repressor LexA [Alkalibacterium gilvum]
MTTRGRKGEKQLEILNFIYKQAKKKGYPPTVREIGEATGLSSTSTVHGHLARLEKNGFILRDPSKPRAIEFTPLGLEKLGINLDEDKIPLLGVVTAGEPILAVEEATDYFPIPNDLELEKGNLFMLTIRGNSMMDVGILDGDQVIVRKQESANNGDIVIAMTDEYEATCKRFFKEADHIRLQPENETMEPILLNDVSILGKVISLYRSHIL